MKFCEFEQIKDIKKESIRVRLTSSQKEIIEARAKEKKLKVSQYILQLIFNDLKNCR